MGLNSLLRLAEHEALSRIELSGKVLDLGGDRRSTYRGYLKGSAEFTIVNLSQESAPDLMHNLEQPLPLVAETFDGVLLINVLEHIFNYRQLLAESARVLKPDGMVVVVVPFLFPVHPSPKDFWRFTDEALKNMLAEAGFKDIKVEPLGSGVFAARYVLLDRLLPSPLRILGSVTFRYLAMFLDSISTALGRLLGKKYRPADYALGYCATARKR